MREDEKQKHNKAEIQSPKENGEWAGLGKQTKKMKLNFEQEFYKLFICSIKYIEIPVFFTWKQDAFRAWWKKAFEAKVKDSPILPPRCLQGRPGFIPISSFVSDRRMSQKHILACSFYMFYQDI